MRCTQAERVHSDSCNCYKYLKIMLPGEASCEPGVVLKGGEEMKNNLAKGNQEIALVSNAAASCSLCSSEVVAAVVQRRSVSRPRRNHFKT